MRVAIITAGAAGMYASCLNDNTWPGPSKPRTPGPSGPYLHPITTDNPDASMKRVFMGGVRIYLEEKYGWFRALPRWATGWLDSRAVLQWPASLRAQPTIQPGRVDTFPPCRRTGTSQG